MPDLFRNAEMCARLCASRLTVSLLSPDRNRSHLSLVPFGIIKMLLSGSVISWPSVVNCEFPELGRQETPSLHRAIAARRRNRRPSGAGIAFPLPTHSVAPDGKHRGRGSIPLFSGEKARSIKWGVSSLEREFSKLIRVVADGQRGVARSLHLTEVSAGRGRQPSSLWKPR
jgi:hypothetical protein